MSYNEYVVVQEYFSKICFNLMDSVGWFFLLVFSGSNAKWKCNHFRKLREKLEKI